MPQKNRSKSAPPHRSMKRQTGRDLLAYDDSEPRDPFPNSDEEYVFKEGEKEPTSGSKAEGGFRWSRMRMSVYRTDKIDKMKKMNREQEEEIKRLKDDNERYRAAEDNLQKTLKDNRFSSHIYFGNVQYGESNTVVEQAKDVIEELSKMMTEALSNIAELKHTADRNEALLKEYMETVNRRISDMNSHGTQLKSMLEKAIAELSASHSDELVFFEGILALKEEDYHGEMITSFDFMPKKSRRAVQRLVRKYGTQIGVKRFADLLGMASVVTLQNVINGEHTDQDIYLDIERCAALVKKWAKNPDNTPEKFIDIAQNIDKILIKEEAEKLVAEKTEALRIELTRKRQGDAASNSSVGSTIQGIGVQHSGEKGGHQLLRDQMAHITELCDYVLRLEKRMDEMQESQNIGNGMTAQVKKMQEETIAILKKAM